MFTLGTKKYVLSDFSSIGLVIILSCSIGICVWKTKNPIQLVVPKQNVLMLNEDYIKKQQWLEGGFAIIYFGILTNLELVRTNQNQVRCIVKEMKIKENDSLVRKRKAKRAFLQEISVMHMVSNQKNFVKFLGYHENPDTLIMKFYSLGNLKDFIHRVDVSREVENIPYRKPLVCHLAKDIATAIQFIHSMEIIHNDIKPDNILIERNENGSDINPVIALLSDFGICSVLKRKKQNQLFENIEVKAASIRYTSPERLNNLFFDSVNASFSYTETNSESINTKSSDIWSYGIMLYEMICRNPPFNYNTDNEVMNAILTNTPLKCLPSLLTEQGPRPHLYSLYQNCTIFEKEKRLEIGKICKILDEIIQKHMF